MPDEIFAIFGTVIIVGGGVGLNDFRERERGIDRHCHVRNVCH